MPNLTLHRPAMEELAFRQTLLGDESTMAYNHTYGGTIGFPRERWADWYRRWVANPDHRFYRYLYAPEADAYVGETAYHFDAGLDGYVCDVIVHAAHRGRGYGGQGLELLCEAAKDHGIPRLYDDIARDNPSVELFLRHGFREVRRTETSILVVRDL